MPTIRSPPVAHHSSSPEGGVTAFIMANAAGDLALDNGHDSGDELDQLLKDDDSSPSPESDKPLFVERRQPSKFQNGLARRIPGAKSSKSKLGASSSKAAASPSSPNPPVIPRRAEDWEPWKTVLHELYITQNRILRDIIVIMETNYNLRATPKMYKNQFARWNFFKYAIKRRPRNRAEREAAAAAAEAGQDDMALITSSSRSPSRSTDGLISPLLHENSKTRATQLGLTAVRNFLDLFVRIDPTAQQDMVVIGYQDPCFRFLTASMELFVQGENTEGGLFLRRAFLQIESLVNNMTIKGFSDLCFTIPHLLIECDRMDILAVYLRYLSELASRARNQPVRDVASSLIDLLDEPENMMRYVMTLTRANSDTIANHEDAQTRTRKWAFNQFVACQRTSMDSVAKGGEGKHKHTMLRVESQSVYWAQNVVMADPESDELAERWLSRNFPDDFAPRSEALLNKVKTLGAMGLLPPEYERMMECLYIGWLSDYYETVEDWPKMFEWVRRGLNVSAGEQYQVWSIHIEELMRKHGSPDEAEELRKRRLNHEFLEAVRRDVENLTLSLD